MPQGWFDDGEGKELRTGVCGREPFYIYDGEFLYEDTSLINITEIRLYGSSGNPYRAGKQPMGLLSKYQKHSY